MKNLTFIIIQLLFYLPCYAQYTLRYIANNDGLSNNSINCIYEDTDHTLWFGTWDGLNAYNGRDIKKYRYNKNDPQSISNNIIRIITEQNKDYLWISTDRGLNRWNRKKDTFERYFEKEAFPMTGTTPDGLLVCGIRNKGLFIFDDNSQKFISIASDTEINHTKKIGIDSNNILYLLTYEGLLHRYVITRKDQKVILRKLSSVKPLSSISDIELIEGKLFLNCQNLIRIIDVNTSKSDSIKIETGQKVSKMAYANQVLIFKYDEGGYAKYDLNTQQLTYIPELSDKTSIFSMFIGSQNIIWIGTDGQGVIAAYEYTSPFRTVKINHPVRCFNDDGNDNLLIGTKGEGIKIMNKQTGEITASITTQNGLQSNSIYSIAKNKEGDIFIGGDGKGLSFIPHNSKQVKHLQIPHQYPVFESVYSILFTHNDTKIWLGTVNYGLIVMDINKKNNDYLIKNFQQYRTDTRNSITNNTIYSIITGSTQDDIWIGTRGGGINKYSANTETFNKMEKINENLMNRDILSLLYSSNNTLWVGTSYGLNKIILSTDQSSISEYSDTNGLANNTIHGILEDNNKNLWISTNYGLSFLNRQNDEIINYTISNGLHNNEFSDNAYYKDLNDYLYFGGVGGFTYFDPTQIHQRKYQPTIKLTNLRINNISQNIYQRVENGTLNVSYEEAYLTLSFIAQDFINNENCKFSYRILNFAEEWIYNEQNANIILTKLPPGKYGLEVKCTNGDGVWSDNIYRLSIKIEAPWWSTPAAYAIYSLILLIIIYITWSIVINRIRLKRQILFEQIDRLHAQKLYESKLNFFTNVAHEFFTPLTLIYGPAQHLLEKAELNSYSKRYVQIIKNNADRMQKLISELMEFRKAEAGHLTLHAESIDMNTFIEYIADSYTEIAEGKKIDLIVNCQNLSTFISDRNSLEKIYSNLFSNAFKYTPANGSIHVNVWQENDKLFFKIKNSGKGLTNAQMERIFDRYKIFESSQLENTRSTGIGLNLTKNLVEFLNGEITVNSVLGEHVEFNVALNTLQTQNLEEKKIEQEQRYEQEINSVTTDEIQTEKSISILIVEDEKNIRKFLYDILCPVYHIREAENGKKGLEIIRKNTPDIIITDILMPDMDGIELINSIKSDSQTSHIPIISISAKNAVEDHINAYKHGADLYITKPFHPQHVLTAVEGIIARHSILKEYFNSSRSATKVIDGMTLHQEDNQFIQKIIMYIENNIDDEDLTASSISDFMSISRATLFRKLKELTNKTPSEFIRLIRLEYASKLLKTTKLTVSEIMYKSGFSHKSYFYKEFAKQYKMSPKEFRETHIG